MRKVISAFFGVLCTAVLLAFPCSAEALKPGDATPEEICREIVTVYNDATKRADLRSFSGYCGSYVGYETYLLGIDSAFTPTNGCDVYDKYRKLDTSTGGYGIRAYSGKQYTIREALNEICAEGAAYDILLGFQQGSNTPDGKKYGHCVFVNAIIDGEVYFSESYDFWIDNKKHKEGEALVCDLDYFCAVYERFLEFEGIIHFTSPGSLPAAGQCGDHLQWYYEAGKLSFSGDGAMWDGAPWSYLYRFVRELEIPEGVSAIGDDAFRGFTRLSTVQLPGSITKLGSGAFAECPYLASINLGKNVAEIGAGAFDDCPCLLNVQVQDNPRLRVLSDGSLLWVDGSLLWVDGSTLISCVACPSGKLFIPEDITDIASDAFCDCRMTAVVIGKNVKTVAPGVFARCKGLKSVEVSSGNADFRAENGALMSSDGKTLYACVSSAAWVGVPGGVERIEGFAFAACGMLQQIQLSASVCDISPEAFDGCPGLIRLSVESGNSHFIYKDGILYTKDFLVLVRAINWKESEFVVPAETVELRKGAFMTCTGLKSIVLGAGVQLLGEQCVGYTERGRVDGFTILGSYDSPAYDYAARNGIAFSQMP